MNTEKFDHEHSKAYGHDELFYCGHDEVLSD
jgi:hypothetical protein